MNCSIPFRALGRMSIAAAVAMCLSAAGAQAFADSPKVDKAALDKSFETLKKFDWGGKDDDLRPIRDAIVASHDDSAMAKDLETRLVAVIKSDAPRAAKDFSLRALRTIGTAQSVPAIAELLSDKDLSHMARYALERNTAPEAAKALREALGKSSGAQKIGLLSSIGDRRDTGAIEAVAACLADTDAKIAAAAVAALGDIGNSDAAKTLTDFAPKAPAALKMAITDARLSCAEHLLADGKKDDAKAIYQSLSGEDQPKHVRAGAKLGMVKVAASK